MYVDITLYYKLKNIRYSKHIDDFSTEISCRLHKNMAKFRDNHYKYVGR